MHVVAAKSGPLKGHIRVPGDKSISHRALMLASLAIGKSQITGLLEGEDVMRTAAAMRALGADIEKEDDGSWTINGVGIGGLKEPENILDMGNSGTSARLLTGLLASHPITCFLTGDISLRKRPMARVTDPLKKLGTRFIMRRDSLLPMAIKGIEGAVPLSLETAQASAQVKSALLLSGLNQRGLTEVREKVHTRDHTERMLAAMGAKITSEPWDQTNTQKKDKAHNHARAEVTGTPGQSALGRRITLVGQPNLSPIDFDIPADISSAAFLMVAAALVPGSDIILKGVGVNPLRRGIIDALLAMKGDLSLIKTYNIGGEPVADIHIRASHLHPLPNGVPCHPSIMIDEFPILFIAAAMAKGESRFTGLAELRVKESDRLRLMAAGLTACGADITEIPDGLIIQGRGHLKGGSLVRTAHDHRIAMSFLIAGLVSDAPITIDDGTPIDTSFPGFQNLMTHCGAPIKKAESL